MALLNIFVWILLFLTTCSFVRMLNKRFGEKEFAGPKCKLFFFLCVFSLSFFIRGSWDLVVTTTHLNFENEQEKAILIFFVYFLTEWLPIFVIYLTHLWAFYALIRNQRQR